MLPHVNTNDDRDTLFAYMSAIDFYNHKKCVRTYLHIEYWNFIYLLRVSNISIELSNQLHNEERII